MIVNTQLRYDIDFQQLFVYVDWLEKPAHLLEMIKYV